VGFASRGENPSHLENTSCVFVSGREERREGAREGRKIMKWTLKEEVE
jgi:hypothetical protein